MAYSRRYWKARPPRQPWSSGGTKTELFLHYSASDGESVKSIDRQISTLRGFQNHHMDGNGWNDIGYNLILFQPQGLLKRARLYWGRPGWALPAAQENHNSGTIALCIVSDGEKIKRATVRRIKKAITALHREHPRLARVRGHGEVVQTSCPGPAVRAIIPELQRHLDALR